MPPKGTLGRGLGAMFPDLLKDMDEAPSYLRCGIDELVPNRYQARKDFRDAEHRQLVASIKKNGIIQPIIVRRTGGGYEIIAGERRWRAAQEAGLPEVPVVVREADDGQVAELSLIENLLRESLNPLEEADAYQTLGSRFGLSQEEISLRVGKDRSTVANTIRLLKLPEPAKKALTERKITAGHARALLALEAPAAGAKALATVLKRGLNVRETERLIQCLQKPRPAKPGARRDPHLRELENHLSSLFLTQVRITRRQKKGKIELAFGSAEEMERILALLRERAQK
jgi:ParB family transcriptional regulator, chromosome partitioning protein